MIARPKGKTGVTEPTDRRCERSSYTKPQFWQQHPPMAIIFAISPDDLERTSLIEHEVDTIHPSASAQTVSAATREIKCNSMSKLCSNKGSLDHPPVLGLPRCVGPKEGWDRSFFCPKPAHLHNGTLQPPKTLCRPKSPLTPPDDDANDPYLFEVDFPADSFNADSSPADNYVDDLTLPSTLPPTLPPPLLDQSVFTDHLGPPDNGDLDIFAAEHIVRKPIRAGKPEYLIKWKGYPSSQNTLEPEDNIIDKNV